MRETGAYERAGQRLRRGLPIGTREGTDEHIEKGEIMGERPFRSLLQQAWHKSCDGGSLDGETSLCHRAEGVRRRLTASEPLAVLPVSTGLSSDLEVTHTCQAEGCLGASTQGFRAGHELRDRLGKDDGAQIVPRLPAGCRETIAGAERNGIEVLQGRGDLNTADVGRGEGVVDVARHLRGAGGGNVDVGA